MKRAKAVSLSLAVLCGGLHAAEPASLPPSLLPAEVRTPNVLPAAFSAPNFMGSPAPTPMPSTLTDPVWISAKPATSPTVVPVAKPAMVAAPAVTEIPPRMAAVANVTPPAPGPRMNLDLPTIPITIPEVPVATQPFVPKKPPRMTPPIPTPMPSMRPLQTTPSVQPMGTDSPVAPTPRPAGDPRPPVPPSDDVIPAPRPSAQPLPTPKEDASSKPKDEPNTWGAVSPRPVAVPSMELAAAPLDVLHGNPSVPMHHGTFGSAPIRISRDFPPLIDAFRYSHSQLDTGASDVGSSPATDRVFAQVEYLLWFVNRDSIPILGTTSTNLTEGYLGQPGTVNVIGPGKYGDSTRNGFRARAGAWLNDCGTCGIDGSFFFLGKQSNTTTMSPDQYSVITRPIFAPNGNIEFGQIVSFPNFARGTLTVEDESFLWGADVNARWAICRQCDRQTEWFAGFRYLNLSEKITITENITALEGARDPVGTQVLVQDSFSTRNDFYGGQIGGVHMRRWNRFDLYARGSIALGVTRQEVRIDGFQQVTQPGQPTQSFVGGLLATTTNIGTFSRESFSAVPEITLNLGYWVTPGFKLYAGYNFIYWPNVLRPGGEIDRVVNLSNVPNPPGDLPLSTVARPKATFAETDLAIHGIQFGAEWRW